MPAAGKTTVTPKNNFRSYNFEVPCEGAKTVPVQLDFTTFLEVDVDLQALVDANQISMVQTLFLDNSANSAALVVVIDPNGINQTIVANPNTQGYYPILAPNPTLITFASAGGVVVRVQLVNAPIAGVVWAATHP